ncbi:MAG: hypothetical protein EOO42_13170, partial [Flavobacteriales bacterium]
MKKQFYILTIIGLVGFAGCKKTLETAPRDSIAASEALTTITGVNSLLNTVYSNLRGTGYYGQSFKINPDIMADNIYPLPGLNSNRLITNSVNSPGTHMSLWGLYTSGINQANLVIDATGKVTGTDAEKNKILGQAYGLRALFYWDLVKLYGYNPQFIVDGSDKGVPLVLKPTPTLAAVE